MAKRASWEPGVGFTPAYDELHRCGVGLTVEGSVAGLGHIGGAFHPVRDGRPVLLGYGLDEVAHALVLSHGDGEADVLLSAGGDDGVGVAAAVGPHGEWSSGPGVTHPPHRLPQEVGRAPRRVGPTLPQPGHQHLSGSGGHGEERVIAPLAGVAVVARPRLGQTVAILCPCPACAEATN